MAGLECLARSADKLGRTVITEKRCLRRIFLDQVLMQAPVTAALMRQSETIAAFAYRVFLRIEAFVEKPDVETAQRYLDEGYLWNSGNFIARASAILSEFRANATDMLNVVEAAVAGASRTLEGPSRGMTR